MLDLLQNMTIILSFMEQNGMYFWHIVEKGVIKSQTTSLFVVLEIVIEPILDQLSKTVLLLY